MSGSYGFIYLKVFLRLSYYFPFLWSELMLQWLTAFAVFLLVFSRYGRFVPSLVLSGILPFLPSLFFCLGTPGGLSVCGFSIAPTQPPRFVVQPSSHHGGSSSCHEVTLGLAITELVTGTQVACLRFWSTLVSVFACLQACGCL